MIFKDAVIKELSTVFHNETEFAEKLDIYYDGELYRNIPVIIIETAENRNKTNKDHEAVIYHYDTKAYINLYDLNFLPNKNHNIQIGAVEYKIIEAKEEQGEIVLGLEAYDE